MNNPFIPPLRAHLKAWEHEAAAQWQAVVRAPQTLRRIGNEIDRSMQSQQRIANQLAQSAPDTLSYTETTRMLYLLERVEHQLNALEVRIERIESKLFR